MFRSDFPVLEHLARPVRQAGCQGLLVCLLILLPIPVTAGSSAVILQYHHFSNTTPSSTSISPELFDRQLAFLAEENFTVWTLGKILSSLSAGLPLPDRCAAITIDDAYLSVYETAWPKLKARGWSCTVYVTSEGVDQKIASYMSWDQMRELRDAGVEFGNHSHTHDYLIRLKPGETDKMWRERVRNDISTCQARIKAELDLEATSFVYPFGEYNTALKQIVNELNLVGVGQQSGCLWPGSDFSLLPRYPMSGPYGDMADFRLKTGTLPLPVIVETPSDPIVAPDSPAPTLRLQLTPGDYRLDALTCYASHEGRLDIIWIDREKLILEVTPVSPLPSGRSRYNFSAPHCNGGRYFWYSHIWIQSR